jgi:hypothetical protein
VHLDNALGYGQPQAGAAFLACDRIVGLLELLKQPGLIGSGDTGSRISYRYLERPVVGSGGDADFASVSKVNGVANEINQDLRRPPTLFDLIEQPFDQVAGSVEMRAEADRLVAIASRRYIGPGAPLCNKCSDPIGVIASVREQH